MIKNFKIYLFESTYILLLLLIKYNTCSYIPVLQIPYLVDVKGTSDLYH